MRALFIANGIVGEKPGLSGGEMRFIEIAKEWQKNKIEIHLLSSPGAKRLCEELGLKVILHSISQSKFKNRLTFVLNTFKSFFLPKSLKDFSNGAVYCTSEQLYDLIPGVILKLRNIKNIKLASAVHWLPPLAWWTRKQSTFINSLLFLISERLSLLLGVLFANKLLPVSEDTKRQMKESLIGKMGLKKATAVKCGVNVDEVVRIVTNVKQNKYEAVFMKRLQAVKGIFDLIEIWKLVTDSIPDAKLIIIGSGVDGDRAKQMVKNLKLENNIKFLGVIYDIKEKYTQIASSKLFLLPTYEENWAIVIGEAMAAKVPVLTYGLNELKDVWQDNAIYIPTGNKKLFAETIIRSLKDAESRDRIVRRAFKYVSQFEWSKIAKEELEIITGT